MTEPGQTYRLISGGRIVIDSVTRDSVVYHFTQEGLLGKHDCPAPLFEREVGRSMFLIDPHNYQI